jgi:4'-phosphopantetheinyl transferase
MAADAAPLLSVWRVDLRQPDEWVEEASRMLAPDEREQAAHGSAETRRRRVAGRAALRIALAREMDRPPAALEFVLGANGKPELAGRELDFSVSASDDLCAVAIAAGGPVGIDVEIVVDRPGLERIAQTRFAPSEAEAIGRLPGDARLHAFYDSWTCKEAYLKATGTGLGAPLASVVVSIDGDAPTIVDIGDGDPAEWSLARLNLGPGAAGALALRRPPEPPVGTVEVSPLPLELT